MLRFPCCVICKNRIGEIEDNICMAHPDGIPQEIMNCIDEGKLIDCGNGYSFTEKSDYPSKDPDSDGLLGKLIDVIGS